ncbi:TnsA endonuclease N-terminal domain-containing protein [Pseudoalteromonas sp. S16_S37]|uniref:TnsA endonuclease N-terminal domain-containing protein n=1 Tax=Pseudoalteromonas sp. S16_S37 TaxID=2720228 RepID=UPI0016810338|nr:TnsA endonuclease N-terminal domain-containing protein [Pseudoalteromonas sp. S16_S37]MBD1583097.1 heteromeric transposase endonuclease subunit TnsA [Pseudoalteromonas sp. S16_S37]
MARGRKLETLSDFNRSLKNKYGLGEGIDYKPWLRIQDVKSKKGQRTQVWGRKTGREHHLLSSIESQFFYLAEFSDSVVDIREQFPLLPLNLSQKIAATLGVDHPTVPYSGEPNIMTTDFLLTCRQGEREFYRAVSVKPEDGIDQRTAEKLDIERIWWELLGVEFLFFTGNEITKAQSSNIQWATSPFRSGIQTYTPSQVEAVLTVLEPGKHLLSDLCGNLVSIIQGRSEDGLNIVRYLIAEKWIDVDLNYSIESCGGVDILSVNHDKRQVSNGG